MVIFDSNIWIAFLNKDDSQHKKALTVFENIKDNSLVFITEYLVIEICSVLAMRAGNKIADSFLDMIMNNEDVEILSSSNQFFENIVSFFRKQNIKKLSFVDVSLLFLSRKYEIITFDKELQKALKIL